MQKDNHHLEMLLSCYLAACGSSTLNKCFFVGEVSLMMTGTRALAPDSFPDQWAPERHTLHHFWVLSYSRWLLWQPYQQQLIFTTYGHLFMRYVLCHLSDSMRHWNVGRLNFGKFWCLYVSRKCNFLSGYKCVALVALDMCRWDKIRLASYKSLPWSLGINF